MKCIFKRGFSAFQLKIVALLCMTIDHAAVFCFNAGTPLYAPMRIIGRIAAPLFLFLIVQGVTHTKGKLKYILRLYIAGVVVQALNTLLDPHTVAGFGNILPTFMYTALYIVILERTINSLRQRKWKDLVVPVLVLLATVALSVIDLYMDSTHKVIMRIFAPSIFRLEYSFLFVLLGISWYFTRRPVYNGVIFTALSAVCGLVSANTMISIMSILPFNFYELFLGTQWCMVFAVPFVLLYSGNRGGGLKWFFYAYYPLHQYLIFALASVI